MPYMVLCPDGLVSLSEIFTIEAVIFQLKTLLAQRDKSRSTTDPGKDFWPVLDNLLSLMMKMICVLNLSWRKKPASNRPLKSLLMI